MKDMILVKLGGSLITDKSQPFTPRLDVIRRLAREIHAAREKNDIKLIIGHGGGSFPHLPAKKYQTHKGLRGPGSYRGLAVVQDAASRLNRIVVASILNEGENAISIQPSASCLARDDEVMEWYTKPSQGALCTTPSPHRPLPGRRLKAGWKWRSHLRSEWRQQLSC